MNTIYFVIVLHSDKNPSHSGQNVNVPEKLRVFSRISTSVYNGRQSYGENYRIKPIKIPENPNFTIRFR